jgi:drug/metabolite transporter (DMT)-like permease
MQRIFKGGFLVALGASCYGMMGTFVKLAYKAGYSVAEVTIAQFVLGFFLLLLLTLWRGKPAAKGNALDRAESAGKLAAGGLSLGLTSICYYKAVQTIPVSVAIVLLIQAVWLGIVLDAILQRKPPTWLQLFAVAAVLSGTALAANIVNGTAAANWTGMLWGLGSAVSYTATIYASYHLEVHIPSLKRSFYMVAGGLVMVLVFFHGSLGHGFSPHIFFSWGILISLFGTVLPPLLLNKGMPLIGIGPGSMLASLEIPVSVFMSRVVLDEQIVLRQWVGVVLILFAIVLIHVKLAPGHFAGLKKWRKNRNA